MALTANNNNPLPFSSTGETTAVVDNNNNNNALDERAWTIKTLSDSLNCLEVTGICMPTSTTVHSQSPTSQKLTTSNSIEPAEPDNSQGPDDDHLHLNRGSPKSNPNPTGNTENFGQDNATNLSDREPSQGNTNGEHPHERNSSRRGNGGARPNQSYGGRRGDHGRGGYHDSNHRRSYNRRYAFMQPAGVVPPWGFMGYQTMAPQFMQNPHMQPLMNPPADAPFGYFYPGMPVFPPAPFYPPMPSGLHYDLMRQIDYYFSTENLVKDIYLRQKMDKNGWVPVGEIAKFKMIQSLTDDIHQILEALRYSTIVEIQDDKIRRRYDWHAWILPDGVQIPTLPTD